MEKTSITRLQMVQVRFLTLVLTSYFLRLEPSPYEAAFVYKLIDQEILTKKTEVFAMNGTTKELTDELSKRAGVMTITVKPYEEIKVIAGQEEIELSGPAIILINQD